MSPSNRSSSGVPPSTADASVPSKGEAGAEKDDAERRRRISEAAYYRSQQRGFTPGQEHDDWLEAERALDRGTPTSKEPADNDFPSPK